MLVHPGERERERERDKGVIRVIRVIRVISGMPETYTHTHTLRPSGMSDTGNTHILDSSTRALHATSGPASLLGRT